MNFLKSLGKSFLEAFSQNEYVIRWEKKYPVFSAFLKRRLALGKSYGLFFTFGFVLAALALIYFFSVIQDILAHDPFVEADSRIMNLIAVFRSIDGAKIMLFFTYLGNWQVIISLGFAIIIILWLLDRKRMIYFLVASIVSGGFSGWFFKSLIHRKRPGIGFSLIQANGYAFPSGHALMSMIFYGLVGYFLFQALRKWWQKLLILIVAAAFIFLIGFSRIYLGVHWSSDVLAGWALGLALLLFLISFFREKEKFYPLSGRGKPFRGDFIATIAFLILIVEAGFIYYFYLSHPLKPLEISHPKEIILVPDSFDIKTVISRNDFPKFSESLIGEKMEPISLIIIGSKEKLADIFQKSGWFVAEKPLFRTLYPLALRALLNQPYPTAPVTPSLLAGEPEKIAFEKSTEDNTVRKRHHTRFWLINFRFGGNPVWVGTASFDDGLRYFITHKIRPDIDTERDFIKDNLIKTVLIKDESQIQLVDPLLGKNQTGDQFFTDGKAYVMFLK